MDNKELFERSPDGYDREQVEQYVSLLKAQYKKVFDYAKATEANNEKLKKICLSLSEENKHLKASGSAANTVNDSGVEKIIRLSKEIEKEAASIASKNN